MHNTSSPQNNDLANRFEILNKRSRIKKAQSIISHKSKFLEKILKTSEILKKYKSQKILFSEPILTQDNNAILFPHTINVIQGQAGVHKSRLAEVICSSLLKSPTCKNDLLGFEKFNNNDTISVIYVDTERNLKEQLPFSLQGIQTNAGFKFSDNPTHFHYVSLLEISRNERFEALNEYLEYIKLIETNPLFIVLDVSTDCIEDFNKTSDSLKLIDLMNVAINKYDIVFLCLIHENPRSEKARGHFGTELMNKASTVMQVSFEKDSNQNDTNLVKVRYLKCRSTAKHTPFHIKFCESQKILVRARKEDLLKVTESRKRKGNSDEFKEALFAVLSPEISKSRTEVILALNRLLGSEESTTEKRLKEFINGNYLIEDKEGCSFNLRKEKIGKSIFYMLEEKHS